ncbi:hypothetical protein KDW40_01795 [Burkholderia cenocepacia]|uniref:hypothetical protein n=1 Tax=Burkholderia cenocepacia TaxID=95486 RepID=UPI001B99E6C3|nr:hypothetical protein [Burkholderia cenocepacia]MBR8043168.1 hypothetical protein [Burkholderia cenocepacia]MBR8324462.1 hypothetical protein [Burkholderia cenocepacia]
MTMTLESAKAIYRKAIDPHARESEPAAWWCAVSAEIEEVVKARTARDAAAVIAWWHHDWSTVSDDPVDAATRIRRAARDVGGR